MHGRLQDENAHTWTRTKKMTTKHLTLIPLLMLQLIAFTNVVAQFRIEPSFSTMQDDNINNDYLSVRDNITTFGLSSRYAWETDASSLALSYDGSLHYYQTVVNRTNNAHQLGLLYSHTSGADGENEFTAAASYELGYNRAEYSFFDHSAFQASTGYKHFLSEDIIGKAGYSFQSTRFSALSDFNYAEHAIVSSLSFALPTQTTVILQENLGAKFYSSQTSSTQTGSMQRGQIALSPSVTQTAALLRIGQSLAEATGLSITGQYQWNLQKQTRYLSSDYGFVADDELFDDHYGYEGLHTSIMLTHHFSESWNARLSAGVQNRIYSTLAAYDLEGNELSSRRKDVRSYAALSMEKECDMGFTLTTTLDVIRNASNDAYHAYDNTALTLAVGVPF